MLNDKLKESDKRFIFRLSNATGDALGTPSTATITIQDDDPGFGFEVNQAWVHEDQGEVWLKVMRGYDPPEEAVTDLTAKAGEDFVAANGTLEFAAGERSKFIRVSIINDQVLEANETFRMQLRNPSAGFLPGLTANQTCTVTIVDATGLEPRRFKGVQQLANGEIRLDLAGGVSKPFSNYFSIFQLEASIDLAIWCGGKRCPCSDTSMARRNHRPTSTCRHRISPAASIA